MVEQQNGTNYTEIAYAPWGLKLALMNGQSLTKAFVPLPGAATAVYTSTGLDYYRHSDWLSSSRVTSTPTRALYGDVAYALFGEPYAQSGTSDLSFTGQNQDTVANLYDFFAREYGIQGRWPSPDPLGPGAFSLADPQSLNGYAYVRNTPTSFVDPLGLKCIPGCVGDPTWVGFGGGIGGPDDFFFGGSDGGFGVGFDLGGFAGIGAFCEENPNLCDSLTYGVLFGLGAGITDLLSSGGPQSSSPQSSTTANSSTLSPEAAACESKVLSAIEKVTGTDPSSLSLKGLPFANGVPGTLNFVFTAVGLPAGQFNLFSGLGRFPLNPITYFIGYGPTLHLTGPTLLNPQAQFANSNPGINGPTSVTFTAHLDSAYPYSPIGLLLHFIIDFLGIGGSSCP